MKRSRFSEEQIIGILKEGDGESSVKVVCAKHNISEATYYAWKKKYGGMDVAEARRLRALEEENGRLRRLERGTFAWPRNVEAGVSKMKLAPEELVILADEG